MVSVQDMHHTCHNVEIFQERGWKDGQVGGYRVDAEGPGSSGRKGNGISAD